MVCVLRSTSPRRPVLATLHVPLIKRGVTVLFFFLVINTQVKESNFFSFTVPLLEDILDPVDPE